MQEIQDKLDPHLIPELNNLVTGYIYPYLDGEKYLERVQQKREQVIKEKMKAEQAILETKFSKEEMRALKKRVENVFKYRLRFCESKPYQHIFLYTNASDYSYMKFCEYFFQSIQASYSGCRSIGCSFDNISKNLKLKLDPDFNFDLYPDPKVEIEAKLEYENDVFIFERQIRENITKYENVLKKYVIEAFETFLDKKLHSTEIHNISIKIPLYELDNSPLGFEILKAYLAFSNIQNVYSCGSETGKVVIFIDFRLEL